MFVSPGAAFRSRANSICKSLGLQGRSVWFDAEANLWALASREGIVEHVAKCKAANINTIIVDVKPLSGLVLYASRIAPRLSEFQGRPYPPDHDLLQVVAEEGHKCGIAVHAAINVFSEGSQKLHSGPAFDHPEWQCIEYGPNSNDPLRPVGDDQAVHHAVFVNPINPSVTNYELSIIDEICTNYDIDGIVLDRMRYPNIYSDFSDLTRRELEKQLGHSVKQWPEDVYVREAGSQGKVKPGPLFKNWLRLRAQVIRKFLDTARRVAKSNKPEIRLGVYVGSWYPIYYDVGVNWGSPENRCTYDWWPEDYESTGYADLVDYICTGCYYECVTREEAVERGVEEWRSVEAAAEESINAVMDATFVYGSLYLLQYQKDQDRFRRAIEQCLEKTQGCMLFDLVYLRDYDWWSVLEEVFASPARAPHEVTEILDVIRKPQK